MDFTPTEEEKSLLSLLLSGEESNINLAKSLFEYSVAPDLGMDNEQDFLNKFGYGQIYKDFNSFGDTKLEIGGKGIKSLPNILPDSLEIFYCNDNPLGKLPMNLPTNLKVLLCDRSNLGYLPNLPDNLIELFCMHNQISNLPVLPQSLKHLNCAINKLTELPQLPNKLIKLEAESNKIVKLSDLPDTITYLDVSNNELTSLPERLPASLIQLHCGKNRLKRLPDVLPINIKFIDLSGNNFDEKYIYEYRRKYKNLKIKNYE